jgi:phenylacetate-CoA ligase
MPPRWLAAIRNHPLLLPAEVRARNGGNELLSMLVEYERGERLPPAELASRQRMRFRALARHATTESPHFAQRLKRADLTPDELAEPGGLEALPPLSRRGLVDAGEGLFCRAVPPGHEPLHTTTTSGSTGEPITVRRTAVTQAHWLACTLRDQLWHRSDPGGRLAVLRANIDREQRLPDHGAPSSLVFRTGPAEVFPPTRPIGEAVRWLLEFSPHQLLVLPSSLQEILAELDRSQSRLLELRSVRTLSETVSPRLRQETLRMLELEIEDSYSSQEGGIMATQCPEAGTYHISEHVRLEVVDAGGRACAPGQVGRLLLTDLMNFATPIVRYEIGDYAEVAGPCACGRSLPGLRRILGRERNLVLRPDGSRHWPLVGFHRWGDVFPVRQFQFVQRDRHTIEARMSAAGRPTREQESRLAAIIQEQLGHPFAIHFQWQEEPLPRGAGGKFEEFQCRAV